MPQKSWSPKRERQYQHIKESLLARGKPEALAEEIAARVVNKERAQAGEARESSASSVEDMPAGRRGGLAFAQGRGRAHRQAAAQRGPPARHPGPLENEQGATGSGAQTLTPPSPFWPGAGPVPPASGWVP